MRWECKLNLSDLSRRAFVAGAATAAAAVPAVVSAADAPAATPVAAPSPAPGWDDVVPFTFDRAALAALLNKPYEHRQVATAKSFADARDSLNLLRNSIEAYADPKYFAGGPNALHAVTVYYHGDSPMLAIDDAMFAKYPIAAGIVKYGGAKPGIEKTATTNPGSARVKEFAAKYGMSFLICNNALSGISAGIAAATAPAGTAPTRAQVVAIHEDLVAHFLPGAVLVPAGVAAINAAQEARFTLLPV